MHVEQDVLRLRHSLLAVVLEMAEAGLLVRPDRGLVRSRSTDHAITDSIAIEALSHEVAEQRGAVPLPDELALADEEIEAERRLRQTPELRDVVGECIDAIRLDDADRTRVHLDHEHVRRVLPVYRLQPVANRALGIVALVRI